MSVGTVADNVQKSSGLAEPVYDHTVSHHLVVFSSQSSLPGLSGLEEG